MIFKQLNFSTFIFALLIMLVAFSSCEENDPESRSFKRRIKKIVVTECDEIYENEVHKYYIHLEYDAQNRLAKYTEERSGSTNVTTISYSGNEVSLNMDGRDLGKFTLNDEGYAVKYERKFSKPCTYEYDADNYLIKSDDGEGANTYGYENGNLVSWTWGYSSGTFITSKIEDKMNGAAFYQSLWPLIRGYAAVAPAYLAGLFGKTSPYLPEKGEEVFTFDGKKTSYELTFVYEFDNAGYITRQMKHFPYRNYTGDMIIEYEEYD